MKITKQKLESLILEEIKSLQEGMPADPNLPSLQGVETSIPGDYLGQNIEIQLLNSIGVDPQKYMLDMSQVESQLARENWEDFMGNGILHDFVFDRPQPGESEAPSRQASKRIPNADRYFAAKFGMQENRGLKENKMKLTKQQLKHIIKEEIGNLLEVASRDMRVATLGGRPGLDQNPQKDEATLDAVKSMSQRQPEGPIGVDTIQNAINSGDFSTMKNVVLDALDYLGKMRMRYAGAGTGGVVDRWAKNSYKYGLEREENNPTPERHAEARKEFVKEDLMSLLRFVQTGEQ